MSDIKLRNEDNKRIQLWRTVKERLFRTTTETYYLATPYLKGSRLDLGHSIRSFAEKAQISPTFYHRFESGKERATEEYIKKIESVFNGTLNTIKDNDDK